VVVIFVLRMIMTIKDEFWAQKIVCTKGEVATELP
jgi:hypothetical protein